LTLGKGKKLVDNSTIPAAFTLIENSVTPSGVIIAKKVVGICRDISRWIYHEGSKNIFIDIYQVLYFLK
jgi:hypothetical protein